MNLLHVAATAYRPSCLGRVIDLGMFDINCRAKDSLCTPLHLAAQYGLTANVRILLERGANIDAEDRGKHYLFDYSSSSGVISRQKHADCPGDPAEQHRDDRAFELVGSQTAIMSSHHHKRPSS